MITKKVTPREVTRMARSIQAWAQSDSGVRLSEIDLRVAVALDAARSGKVLSVGKTLRSDCARFVCGGASGEIPQRLIDAYPLTHDLLVRSFS